jgi:anti-sigma B factor antagonist
MNKDIEITTSQKSDISIINIKGDVTAVTAESIENAYQDISASGGKKILLHFDQGCYINSGGIAVLIGIVSESRKKEQVIRATGLSEHFQKIFNMVGLTKYIQIFPSTESALAGF